jgi:hypothetical protein
MPPGGAAVWHGLDNVILYGKGRAERLGRLANLLIPLGEDLTVYGRWRT